MRTGESSAGTNGAVTLQQANSMADEANQRQIQGTPTFYVQVGDVPVLLASLSTGRIIDGAIIQPPYYLKAVASGMHVLVNMQEMDLPVQQTGLNTTQKFIAKNPDMVPTAAEKSCAS